MDPTSSPASAPVVAALEAMWETIRDRHPDVPAAVLVLGSGTIGMRPGEVKLGHFASTRWRLADASDASGVLAEVFIGGEGLIDGAAAVLGTLLHEAAHAVAHTRQIQDTSRQGRYHNRRYAALAAQMGLTATRVGDIGWSGTAITAETREVYSQEIKQLQAALRLWRYSEHGLPSPTGPDDPSSPTPAPATAPLGRTPAPATERAGTCWPADATAAARFGSRAPLSTPAPSPVLCAALISPPQRRRKESGTNRA